MCHSSFLALSIVHIFLLFFDFLCILSFLFKLLVACLIAFLFVCLYIWISVRLQPYDLPRWLHCFPFIRVLRLQVAYIMMSFRRVGWGWNWLGTENNNLTLAEKYDIKFNNAPSFKMGPIGYLAEIWGYWHPQSHPITNFDLCPTITNRVIDTACKISAQSYDCSLMVERRTRTGSQWWCFSPFFYGLICSMFSISL